MNKLRSLMLHEFLSANRNQLIERCRATVALRSTPKATKLQLEYGIPLFLDQVIRTLQVEQGSEPLLSRQISGSEGGLGGSDNEIRIAATHHGRNLRERGFTVDQVVHDYGDLCQAITGMAFEEGAAITVDEFRTLNRCLDNGIADAVTEFSARQESSVSKDRSVKELNERIGVLAHEGRNLIHQVILAVTAIKAGNVGLHGATGAVLDRSLNSLRNLFDRTIADVRTTAGIPPYMDAIDISDLIWEVKAIASLEAESRGYKFSCSEIESGLAVTGDRDLLLSALGNLIQNAFKFSKPGAEVQLLICTVEDRIRIGIADQCGGLAPGAQEAMFLPFRQLDDDRSGLGLGLGIARRSVEANNGEITVRNIPGTGCIFIIDLPRSSLPAI